MRNPLIINGFFYVQKAPLTADGDVRGAFYVVEAKSNLLVWVPLEMREHQIL